MKKLYILLIMVVFAFTLSACGPNSDYYDLGLKNFYYYEEQAYIFDPYEILLENNSWVKDMEGPARGDIEILKANYDVKVEYRDNGTKENYKTFELNENNVYITDTPIEDLGNNFKYDFKIHFIDKVTKSEKTMINFIGIFAFLQSPANAIRQQVEKDVNETYNVLDNILEKDADNNPVDLTKLYDIEYKVSLDNKFVKGYTRPEDGSVPATIDYTVTFDKAGTYDVWVKLTQKVASTGDDATSSASGGASAGAMILNIVYTIKVE